MPRRKSKNSAEPANATAQNVVSNSQQHIQPDDSEYLEEVATSQRCKDFDDYLKSKPKGDNDCCDFFSDATNNELEYFARKFIDFGVENPKEIKILGYIASKYKTALLKIKKFINDVVKSLEGEFEEMEQEKITNALKIDNFGKLIGELYVSDQQIISPEFMTQFLTFLMNNGKFSTLSSTLELCGYFSIKENQEYLGTLMKSVDFREKFGDKVKTNPEDFEDKDEIYKSRLFKPAESAKQFRNFETMLFSIAENMSVSYNYELFGMLDINTKKLVAFIIDTLRKPDANVIKIAKFFKSFNDFSYKIGGFIQKLMKNLDMKVLDMSVDNLQEMRNLGKFIAELKNLGVTTNDSQKMWLEKVKTLDIDENFEVMEVYIDVLKPMLINIQVHEYDILLKIRKYIQDINNSLEPSYSEIITRIKSKIAQILQNIVAKRTGAASSELFFKIRLGHKIDGLPTDMPEKHPRIFDVQDFAKIFYINAISHDLFTQNYANSIQVLKSGPKGATFIHSLKDTLYANSFPNLFFPKFCESDEAPGTFDFIVHLFNEDVIPESAIISFLQVILELKDLENYKNYASRFLENLQSIAHGRNNKRFSQNLRSCIAKVQSKLKKLDIEHTKVENTEVSHEEVKDEEVKDEEVDDWEDRC